MLRGNWLFIGLEGSRVRNIEEIGGLYIFVSFIFVVDKWEKLLFIFLSYCKD